MMLFLMRHAKAKQGTPDDLRPLARRGIEDATRIARFFSLIDLEIDEIWHSGLKRSLQTARIIEGSRRREVELREYKQLVPNGTVDHALKIVNATRGNVLVVGHEPLIGNLVCELLVGDYSAEILKIKTSCVLALRRKNDRWKLVWAIQPDLLQWMTVKARTRHIQGERHVPPAQ